jgi:hypothetical protein
MQPKRVKNSSKIILKFMSKFTHFLEYKANLYSKNRVTVGAVKILCKKVLKLYQNLSGHFTVKIILTGIKVKLFSWIVTLMSAVICN